MYVVKAENKLKINKMKENEKRIYKQTKQRSPFPNG